MRRAVAFVIAVAMVGGALVIRSRRDDDSGTTDVKRPTGPLKVVCAQDLAEMCRTIQDVDVTVEPARVTLERLTEDEPTFDAWIVTEPWPQMVDESRGRAGENAVFESFGALVTSRVALVVNRERFGAACPGRPVDWTCLGDAAGKGSWAAVAQRPEWGNVKLGFASAPSEALGLLLAGNAASGFIGRADFSTEDVESEPYQARFPPLLRALIPSQAPLTQMLATFPATYDAVATIDAEARAARASGRAVDVIYPAPMATVSVVVAGVKGGRSTQNVRGPLQDVFEAAGWTAAGRSTGLPSPGVLQFLLENEVR